VLSFDVEALMGVVEQVRVDGRAVRVATSSDLTIYVRHSYLLQAEDARQLGLELRAKLLRKIQSEDDSRDPKEVLRELFCAIDEDGSDKLRSGHLPIHILIWWCIALSLEFLVNVCMCVYSSRAEFKEIMFRLGMTFSKKKWNKIFHEIDLNFDDEVSKSPIIAAVFLYVFV
jgi:hypothetical protein